MTVPGEVTFKVKQFIAARERFTTGQVAKLTGLNRKSVETVVQRLVRDGYVVKSRETAPGTGRGRRPLYYTLTADMEKRKELVNEVSVFQPGAVPVRVRPLSANYIGAHDMLDGLEREPDAPDREARLRKIEKHLELAAFEEGLEDGEEGTAVVRAYLLRERARVAALRHQWARAESLLNQARAIFQEHGLEEEVNKLEGMIAGQELERTLTEGPLDYGRLSHIVERLGGFAVASVPVFTVCRLVGAFQETLQAATAVEPEKERTLSLARSLETMARQMHDDIAQTLGYLGLQVDSVMSSSSLAQNVEVQAELKGLRRAIEDAYERMGSSIMRLGEDVPSHFDLGAALPKIISEFEKQSGCRVESRVDGGQLPRLPPSVAFQATYIIRETLTNVRKHSGADSVHLTLQGLEDGRVEVTIQDNGRGFDLDSEQQSGWGGFGLRFMRERAERVGGSLRVESQPGQGTRVVVSLPSS